MSVLVEARLKTRLSCPRSVPYHIIPCHILLYFINTHQCHTGALLLLVQYLVLQSGLAAAVPPRRIRPLSTWPLGKQIQYTDSFPRVTYVFGAAAA